MNAIMQISKKIWSFIAFLLLSLIVSSIYILNKYYGTGGKVDPRDEYSADICQGNIIMFSLIFLIILVHIIRTMNDDNTLLIGVGLYQFMNFQATLKMGPYQFFPFLFNREISNPIQILSIIYVNIDILSFLIPVIILYVYALWYEK